MRRGPDRRPRTGPIVVCRPVFNRLESVCPKGGFVGKKQPLLLQQSAPQQIARPLDTKRFGLAEGLLLLLFDNLGGDHVGLLTMLLRGSTADQASAHA